MGEKESLREESFRQHQERMIAIGGEGNAQTVNQQQQYADARQRIDGAILSSASSVAGNLAGIIGDMAGKQSAAYQAAFLVQQGFALATTVVNTQMAAAAALAPPPIGLGPVAGLPYAGVIQSLGAVNVGIIAAQTVAGLVSNATGARAMGGSVTGGNSYMVGENGPEVVTMGGSGVVTPSSVNAKESKSDVFVTINNAPAGTRTEERTDERGTRFVDVFLADMSNGGPMSRSVSGTFGVRRQGR